MIPEDREFLREFLHRLDNTISNAWVLRTEEQILEVVQKDLEQSWDRLMEITD